MVRAWLCACIIRKKKQGRWHTLLPNAAPEGKELKNTKYTANAISELLTLMKKDESSASQLETCIISGGNVLKRPNDTIGKNNIVSVKKLLEEQGKKICAKDLGGMERRTDLFDIEKGCVYFTVCNSKQKTLWQTTSEL